MPRLTQPELAAASREARTTRRRLKRYPDRPLTPVELAAMIAAASRTTPWQPPRAPEWLRELGEKLEKPR